MVAGSSALAVRKTCSSMGRPATGWRPLGSRDFMRVPWPAASITTGVSGEVIRIGRTLELRLAGAGPDPWPSGLGQSPAFGSSLEPLHRQVDVIGGFIKPFRHHTDCLAACDATKICYSPKLGADLIVRYRNWNNFPYSGGSDHHRKLAARNSDCRPDGLSRSSEELLVHFGEFTPHHNWPIAQYQARLLK